MVERSGMEISGTIADLFGHIVGGSWSLVYSQKKSTKSMYVFQNAIERNDIRVLRSDDVVDNSSPIQLLTNQKMYVSRFMDDPALIGLSDVLANFSGFTVLRYRPGKRITLLADDNHSQPIILKLVASGIQSIYEKQQHISHAAANLGFYTSSPLWKNAAGTLFAQSVVPGNPLRFDNSLVNIRLAQQIAEATHSLHHSGISLPIRFTASDQQHRSGRYCQFIKTAFPNLTCWVNTLQEQLVCLQQVIEKSPQAYKRKLLPVHGSLHSHQWLQANGELSLVDFDRSAMGERELDFATFLTEWDYESPRTARAIKSAFIESMGRIDPVSIAFYRAHKHLAKTFKAAKSVRADSVDKTARNLHRALYHACQTDKVVV